MCLWLKLLSKGKDKLKCRIMSNQEVYKSSMKLNRSCQNKYLEIDHSHYQTQKDNLALHLLRLIRTKISSGETHLL